MTDDELLEKAREVYADNHGVLLGSISAALRAVIALVREHDGDLRKGVEEIVAWNEAERKGFVRGDYRHTAACLYRVTERLTALLNPTPPLVIEAGGTYRMRDGRRAVVSFQDGDVWIGHRPGISERWVAATWDEAGRWSLENGDLDLIALWEDPANES